MKRYKFFILFFILFSQNLYSQNIQEKWPSIIISKHFNYEYVHSDLQTLEIKMIKKISISKNIKDIFYEELIPFRKSYQKIKIINAYTKIENDKKLNALIKEEHPYGKLLRDSLYSENKIKKIQFYLPNQTNIIYFHYQLEWHFFEFLEKDIQIYLQDHSFILNQEYSLKYPLEKKVFIYMYKNNLLIRKTFTKKKKIFFFKKTQTAPFIKDDKKTYLNDIPYIHFSTFTSWKQIGNAFEIFLKEKNNLDSFFKNNSFKEIKDLYSFIAHPKNISNVFIPFSLSGYFPHSAHEILKYKYSDAKDKSFLLYHLIKKKWPEANLFLGLSNPFQELNSNFVNLESFKSIFLVLREKNKDIILDPYSIIYPFGEYPEAYYGKKILLISEKQKPFWIKMKNISSKNKIWIFNTDISIKNTLEVKKNTKIIRKGMSLIYKKIKLLKNFQKEYKKNSLKDYQDLFNHENSSSESSVNTFKLNVQESQQKKKLNAILGISFSRWIEKILNEIKNSREKIFFKDAFILESNDIINYPEEWDEIETSKNIKLKFNNWIYKSHFNKNKNQIIHKRQLIIESEEIEVKEAIEFLLNILKDEKEKSISFKD